MNRRKIASALLAVGYVVASQVTASASVTRYIDGPRNERTIAVESGVHAWSVDTAAHPYVYSVWVKPDGGPAYRVSSLASSSFVGNIDLGNPTFGDVLVFSSSGGMGTRPFDIKLWDLANHEPLPVPARINTPVADEAYGAISGDYLVFTRYRREGSRLLLYQFSTHSFTLLAASPHRHVHYYGAIVSGDYIAYHHCLPSGGCTVYRRQISTGITVKAPHPSPRTRAEYFPTVLSDGTVYYVQGDTKICGHHARLMRWSGSGSATTLALLPETIEAGPTDAYNNGVTTTLFFRRIRCRDSRFGIYQLSNA